MTWQQLMDALKVIPLERRNEKARFSDGEFPSPHEIKKLELMKDQPPGIGLEDWDDDHFVLCSE